MVCACLFYKERLWEVDARKEVNLEVGPNVDETKYMKTTVKDEYSLS
jgi:hypothetical protein